MSPRDQPIDATMSFGDHLEELRKRLLLALAFPIPAAVIIYFFSNTIIQWLLLPLFDVLRDAGLPPHVQQLSPPEAIVTQIKISMVAALVLSAPWILWQAWKFVSPGLYLHEKRFVRLLVPGSIILTIIAVLCTYFIMMPLMLRVLVAIGMSMSVSAPEPIIDPRARAIVEQNPPMILYETAPKDPQPGQTFVIWPEMKRYVVVEDPEKGVIVLDAPRLGRGLVSQDFRLSEYISFVLMFILATAIAFQMPLVVLLLGWVGLASVGWLRSRRKYAFFICAVVAAVVTPTADVISMLVLLVPLYGLYELGILLLALAPASAVAEGKVFSLDRFWARRTSQTSGAADNRREPMDRPAQPAQSEFSIARRDGSEQVDSAAADGEETRS